jgi:uncharacterized membrane protein
MKWKRRNMNNDVMILAEIVSAILCFVLVRFMMKPYQYTGESRYIGLPLGFSFLGASYLLMGLALYFETTFYVEDIKWLQLFTQAYAFAFLAATYYFSKQPLKRNTRLWWQVIFSALVVGAIASYLIVFEPPSLALPSYKTVDEYFKGLNIILVAYITVHTIRSHASQPDPKTIWIPLGYILLAFGQYSSLIWSLDSSYSAFVGAHIVRLAALLIFLFVAFRAFVVSQKESAESTGP